MKKDIKDRKYGDIKKGTYFGYYEIVSEPLAIWTSVHYNCRCKKCGIVKIIDARELLEGRQCRCVRTLPQEEKKRRNAIYNKKWRMAHPCYNREYEHNVTQEQYDKLLDKQEKKCYICGREHNPIIPRGKGKLHIDHDHITGKIRGLLCHKCNVILGFAEDKESIFLKAIEYIRRYK